jgi:HD-GYP domain-containing protein (c-di-GMP phosphodiesterase class II)
MKAKVPLFDLIWCLSETVDLISSRAARHHLQTAYIAACIAEELGLPETGKARLILAASIHDVGSLSLKAPAGPAGSSQAEAGYRLMRGFEPLAGAAQVVRYHQVPWAAGRGVAAGGIPVPEESHILHLADRAAAMEARGGALYFRSAALAGGRRGAFVPAHLEAFERASAKESFWLDLASGSLRTILAGKVKEHSVPLDLDGVGQLGLFFSQVIDFRSHFTASHSSGVSACAEALAGMAGFSGARRRLMGVAGHVHDLGKLAVPRRILQKAGPLSAEEKAVIRSHAYYTHRILSAIPALATVREWGALHHERLDGSGYPFRYKGARLCTGSRIMAVADVFTALSEDRPYRSGLKRGEVLSIMRGMARDSALDRELVALLEKNYGELEYRRRLSHSESAGRYRLCFN